jgi:signal transduction histidine kinase
MLLPASPEFVALCRSQVALVTQGLGASLGAVYLMEDLTDPLERHLVPVVVYPEVRSSQRGTPLSLPGQPAPDQPLAVPSKMGERSLPALPLLKPQQIVLPLIHEDLVMGLLVVGRDDRQWQAWEQTQLEEVARTLAIARFLDQRHQWLEQATYRQRQLQGHQQDSLANLLHQFRNPLTTLRTLGKLLLKRLHPDDNNRTIAASIIQESDRLQDLLRQFDQVVEDLGEAALDTEPGTLTVSEQTSLNSAGAPGEVPLKQLPPATGFLSGAAAALVPCSLVEILQALLGSATAVAEEHHLELQVDLPPDLPPVSANPQALREVCSNLLDNALKYTPPGGKVWLQVSQATAGSQSWQKVIIANTGPGIPPQDLEHLFERHYRGVQAQTDIPGTGLGLAIARTLVEQMGGTIQALSPAFGVPRDTDSEAGVTFIVHLPECSPTPS